MARAHFVKKARKSYKEDGIKKGDSYWWWAFMVGGRGGRKHRSKTKPKPSQLTQSEFMSGVLSAEESLGALTATMSVEDIKSEVENIVSELEQIKDETDDKFNNMPDGLQQGDTGQLLEGRVAEIETMIDTLNSIDYDAAEEEEKTANEAKVAGPEVAKSPDAPKTAPAPGPEDNDVEEDDEDDDREEDGEDTEDDEAEDGAGAPASEEETSAREALIEEIQAVSYGGE